MKEELSKAIFGYINAVREHNTKLSAEGTVDATAYADQSLEGLAQYLATGDLMPPTAAVTDAEAAPVEDIE